MLKRYIFLFAIVAASSAKAADIASLIAKLRSPDRKVRISGVTEARSLVTPEERASALRALIEAFGTVEDRYPAFNQNAPDFRAERALRQRNKELLEAEFVEFSFSIGLLGKGNVHLVQEVIANYQHIRNAGRSGTDIAANIQASLMCEEILLALYSVDPALMLVHAKDKSVVSRALLMTLYARLAVRSQDVP